MAKAIPPPAGRRQTDTVCPRSSRGAHGKPATPFQIGVVQFLTGFKNAVGKRASRGYRSAAFRSR
jgi:hypothetical protein